MTDILAGLISVTARISRFTSKNLNSQPETLSKADVLPLINPKEKGPGSESPDPFFLVDGNRLCPWFEKG
jgi:hypothetical protein